MADHPHQVTADRSEPAPATRSRQPLGWGTNLAIAGLAIFAVGLIFVGWAYDSMTVDQPDQWLPIYLALGVVAGLAIGLVLRSRVAHALAMGLAAYELVIAFAGMLSTGLVGPWQFGLISIVPASLVVVGLAASWKAYWRPASM